MKLAEFELVIQSWSVTGARNNLVNHELATTKQFCGSDPKDGVTMELLSGLYRGKDRKNMYGNVGNDLVYVLVIARPKPSTVFKKLSFV